MEDIDIIAQVRKKLGQPPLPNHVTDCRTYVQLMYDVLQRLRSEEYDIQIINTKAGSKCTISKEGKAALAVGEASAFQIAKSVLVAYLDPVIP